MKLEYAVVVVVDDDDCCYPIPDQNAAVLPNLKTILYYHLMCVDLT
jgi:hypothetical protein